MRPIKILSIVQKFSETVSKLNLNKMAVFLHQKDRISDSDRSVTFFIGKILKDFDLTRNDFTLETFSLSDEDLEKFISKKQSILNKLELARIDHELYMGRKRHSQDYFSHEEKKDKEKMTAFDSVITTINNLISDANAQLLLREMSKK